MKVFDVLVESLPDGWSLNRENGRWVARDPQGNVRASGRVRGNVEGRARDWIANNTSSRTPVADPEQRSAADRGSSERGRPSRRGTSSGGRQEPPLTRDSSRPSPVADPERRNPALRPDPRPGTPTTNTLSAGERRTLSRTGSVRRNGVTYSRSEILAADAEAERFRNSRVGSDVRPGDDRAASANRNPQADAPVNNSWTRRAVRYVWNTWPMRVLRRIIGPAGANAINSAINAAAVEDALDAYLRATFDYAVALEANDRQPFLDAMESDSAESLPPALLDAYLECVERITQLLIEAIVGVISGVGGGALAVYLLGLAGLSTGGIGIILALVGGGILAIAGTTALYRALEAAGVNDWVENQLAKSILSPGAIFWTAVGSDAAQEVLAVTADWILEAPSNIPGIGNLVPDVGTMIRDSENDQDADRQAVATIDSESAERALKNFVKSDPELMQAYQAGKEEAKEIIRSAKSNQR